MVLRKVRALRSGWRVEGSGGFELCAKFVKLSSFDTLSKPCPNLDLHPLKINMASPLEGHDEFIHQIAIKLSRAINTVNPNDLLARNVVEIAKTQSMDGFMTGVQKHRHHRDFISISTFSGQGFWQVQGFFSSRIIYRNLVACQGGNDRCLVATDTRHYGS